MKLKKVIALAAAGALALSLAACHISTPDVAVTVNGTDIPAGLYLAYQMQAATSADNQLKAQDKSLKDRDATLERDGQQLSAQDWVKAETRAGVARSVWATQQFDEQGLSFTEEELASIDSMVAMAYSYSGDLFSENGIGEASFKAYYTAEMKYQKLLDQYVEENRKDVPDADVKAYVDEHYNRVRALTLPTTNADYEKVGDEDLAVIQGLSLIHIFAGDLLQAFHMLEDIGGDLLVDLAAIVIILGAGLGGNGEALGHGHARVGHLGQAGAFAAQGVLHSGLVSAEGFVALAEEIQILLAQISLPPYLTVAPV